MKKHGVCSESVYMVKGLLLQRAWVDSALRGIDVDFTELPEVARNHLSSLRWWRPEAASRSWKVGYLGRLKEDVSRARLSYRGYPNRQFWCVVENWWRADVQGENHKMINDFNLIETSSCEFTWLVSLAISLSLWSRRLAVYMYTVHFSILFAKRRSRIQLYLR